MSDYVTRSMVYHNGLDESIHRIEVEYSEDTKLIFVFSSELYKNIFTKNIDSNREKINAVLSKRYGFNIKNNIIADIKLYKEKEKRGFLIIGNREYRCLNDIQLNGQKLI